MRWRFYRAVRDALRRCTVVLRDDPRVGGRRVDGYYDPDQRMIVLRRSLLADPDRAVTVVLHEAIHAAGLDAGREYTVDGVLDRMAFRSWAARWHAARRLLQAAWCGTSEPGEEGKGDD